MRPSATRRAVGVATAPYQDVGDQPIPGGHWMTERSRTVG